MAFIQKLGRNRYRARYRAPTGAFQGVPPKADATRFLSAVETDKARGVDRPQTVEAYGGGRFLDIDA